MERFLWELHHLVALCPGIQLAVKQGRGDDICPVGQRRAEVIETLTAVEGAHALTHQLLLRIGGAELIELLAPHINLVMPRLMPMGPGMK